MLGKHKRAALQFSGGKDSTTMLHLARPHLDNIEVFFGDSGSIYPHVLDFVVKTCHDLGAHLVIVNPPMPVMEYHKEKGLPADVVPLDACPDANGYLGKGGEGTQLQSWQTCCARTIWLPMEQAIRARGHTLVLRGSKSCDSHRTAPPGTVHDGVEYQSPLWDWSHQDVMDYLAQNKIPTAHQYPAIQDSMDCWCCTALMTGPYAEAKLEYARHHYPDLWPTMVERLREMQRAVNHHTGIVNRVIDRATHGP